MEKLTWEQVDKAEELRRAKELKDQRDAQQLALKDIIKVVEKKGNDPVELEEKRRAFEEQCKRQLEAKMREQQERLDRLELLYKGPPSGRERG
jgi:DNA-binding transcriptional MerR regulator